MAKEFAEGLFQATVGGIATVATLGLNQDVQNWTAEGARKVADNSEKAWGADGEVTQFAESLPGIGYIAAAGHGISSQITGSRNDEMRARRATAASTKSSMVTGGAIVGGFAGGPAGALAGAAFASGAGQCTEKGINHAIDKQYQTPGGTFDDFDATSFVKEMAIDGIVGGVSAGTASVAKDASRKVVGGGVKRYVVKKAVKSGVPSGVGACTKTALNKGSKTAF